MVPIEREEDIKYVRESKKERKRKFVMKRRIQIRWNTRKDWKQKHRKKTGKKEMKI